MKIEAVEVERVQTGVRIEKRILKVLKALAELKDITLGDLLESIVLHAFEGKACRVGMFQPVTRNEESFLTSSNRFVRFCWAARARRSRRCHSRCEQGFERCA